MALSVGEQLMRAAEAGPNQALFTRWAMEALDKALANSTPQPGQRGYAAHILSQASSQTKGTFR